MKNTSTQTNYKGYILSTLLRAIIGAGCAGLVTAVVMLVLFWAGVPQNCGVASLLIFYKSFIASTIIGFVFGGASILFDLERLSLLLATFLHFVVLSATYFGLSIWAEWIYNNTLLIIIQAVCFVAIYLLIWFINYFTRRKQIKQLNKELTELSQTNN